MEGGILSPLRNRRSRETSACLLARESMLLLTMTWVLVLLLLTESELYLKLNVTRCMCISIGIGVAQALDFLEEPQNKSVTVGSNVFQPCVCNRQLLPYWIINGTVYPTNELPDGFLVNATGLFFTNVQLHHSGTVIQCQFSTFENSSFLTIYSRIGVITVHAAYGKKFINTRITYTVNVYNNQ